MRLKGVLFAGLIVILSVLQMAGPGDSAKAEDAFWPSPLRVSIVWPQDGQGNPTSVDKSRAVNISLWPSTQVSCTARPGEPEIWVAKDNEPAQPVSISGEFVQRTVNGITFPALEYNNVPANLVAEPRAKYRFFSPYGGSNIWVNAIDPRTFFPEPIIPTGYSGPQPNRLDARIQIVWPHDEKGQFAPVDRAQYLNIAVDLFEHGTLNSVPPDYDPEPAGMRLSIAKRNDPPRTLYELLAQKTTYVTNERTFPRWVFNDVPVEPGEQYHFRALVIPKYGKIPDFTTSIWTHALDARTILPNPVPPPACAP